MTGAVRTYLLAVAAASLLSGILLSLTPKGPVHRTLTFLCGLVILLTALGPVARLDLERLAGTLSQARLQAGQAAREVEDGTLELTAAVIKEKAEAYIWDKAAALGFTPAEVTVAVRSEGEYPYPYGATIVASCTAEQRRQLTELLARELAIGPEKQEWITDEKD